MILIVKMMIKIRLIGWGINDRIWWWFFIEWVLN